MQGTQTSSNQSNNGHRIRIGAESNEGVMFTEKELREIITYLEAKGFSGYTEPIAKRVSLREIGLKLFGQ